MSEGKPLTLGARIRSLRMAKGLTQGEITKGEITAGLISQIESDRVAPSRRVITLLAAQLGVNPNELMSEVETRSLQMQKLKEARELLQSGHGEAAAGLLEELQSAAVAYVSEMDINLELARARELMGRLDDAAHLYSLVECHAFLTNDFQLGANCMSRQGELYVMQGRISLALYCFKRALSFVLDLGAPPLAVLYVIRKNIAICSYRLGNIATALTYAAEAYEELKDTSHRAELAEICHILAVLHVESGNREESLAFSMDAVNMYRALGMDAQHVDAKMNYAIVLREIGDHESALALLPGIIVDYYAQGRNSASANAWTERATCELLANRLDDAARSLERALAIAVPNSLEYAEILRVTGLIQAASEQREEAIATFERALSLLLPKGMLATGKAILGELATLHESLGSDEQAIASYSRMGELEAHIEQQRWMTRILT
ncbi:MAG: helix-turn-helix domain-containing protein [Bacilli bacterium]